MSTNPITRLGLLSACEPWGWYIKTYTGWWLSHHLEKYEFVNRKDDIPTLWKKKSSLKPPTSTKLDDFVRANVGICMYKYSSTMVSCYMGVTSTKLDPPTVQLGKTYRKPWILWKLVSFLQMFPKTPNSCVSGM